MEPAVRSPRIEPAISTDRTRRSVLARKTPKIPEFPDGLGGPQPYCGERNFWMQRREAKIGLRDRKCHRRLNEQNDTGENPHTKRPILTRPGNLRFGRTGWWWKQSCENRLRTYQGEIQEIGRAHV